MTDLERAEEALDKFLMENPQAAAYQFKIDKALEGVTDPAERYALLKDMAEANLKELTIVLDHLRGIKK